MPNCDSTYCYQKTFQKTILLLILHIGIAFAQPEVQTIQSFDAGRGEALHDIYAVENGDYALCGVICDQVNAGFKSGSGDANAWVLRIDDAGEILWSYEAAVQGDDYFNSIIETDEGEFMCGGVFDGQFGALLLSGNGEFEWQNEYGEGICYAAIELKDGDYILAGLANRIGVSSRGLVVCINHDGEVQWQSDFDEEAMSCFTACRETEGGIVLCGRNRPGPNNDNAWLVKIDFNGEELWNNSFNIVPERRVGKQNLWDMVSCPNGDFMSCGMIWSANGGGDLAENFLSFKFNNQGESLSHGEYQLEGGNYPDRAWGITRLTDDCYVLVGECGQHADQHAVICVNSNCEELWRATYSFQNHALPNVLYSAVCNDRGEIVAVGTTNSVVDDEENQNGMLLKLEQFSLAPRFLSWSPEDTVLSTLINEEIIFSVHCQDQRGLDITYQWIHGEEALSNNTSETMRFNELGFTEMSCIVSNSEYNSNLTWHITVDNFFIASTTPDSLRLLTRRGNTLPFSMDVACVEPDAPTVEWTVVNRDNDREYLGEADTIEVCFDLAGEWAVEAEANWNGERESVRWVVDVRSAVWWWMPHEDAISVNRNEQRDFSVFAFDPDSDSLSIGWWLDGDSLDSNAEVLTLDFPDIGEHSLVSIVRDGVEADTITWAITVNESGVGIDQNGIPIELALHPPAPNPFNSTTTIGYSLPVAGNVSLAVYDLSGREVARLVDGVKVAGNHQVTWNANDMASGVYVVAMDVRGVMLREKVVLVK